MKPLNEPVTAAEMLAEIDMMESRAISRRVDMRFTLLEIHRMKRTIAAAMTRQGVKAIEAPGGGTFAVHNGNLCMHFGVGAKADSVVVKPEDMGI